MEKIVLGKYKFIGNQNTDEYIDIELNREIESLKKDFIYNTFDFQDQFIKERNVSLKFCLYGLVESRYGHCDNLNLKIKIKNINNDSISTNSVVFVPHVYSAATSGYSFNVLTKPLSNESILSKNIYGTNKGCYFFHFEIDKNDLNSNKQVTIEIFDSKNELYGEFTMPFIFFDSDGQFIEFGTESADFNNNNEIETVNNNFPFFFDKHWVKLNLEPHGPQVVEFENSTMRIKENNASNFQIPVTLKEPSKYGLEKVKIIVDYGLDSSGKPLTDALLGIDFQFNEQVISWDIGEKTKYINFNIINDLKVENVERVQLRLIPLLNSRLDINSNNSMILYIDSEDIPITAYFTIDSFETYRPILGVLNTTNVYSAFFNTINTVAPQKITIRVNFSAPLTTVGEEIVIKHNNSSSAQVYDDYYFNYPKNKDTEIKINIPLSATSVTFDLYFNGKVGYAEEETIILDLVQSTLGIVPVSQSNNNSFPQIKIKLKDSTLPLFTRFIIPINKDTYVGIYKPIFISKDVANSYTILRKNSLDLNETPGKSQQEVTNDFRCDFEITNEGSDIFYNNKKIKTGELFIVNLILTSITENIAFDLPSNSDWIGFYYNSSKYGFKFINVERFYPKKAIGLYDEYNLEEFTIEKPNTQKYNAGFSGTNQYNLISEVYNAYSTYDVSTAQCTTQATNLNSGKILYNGAILLPPNSNVYQKSSVRLKFLKNFVSEECYNNNDNNLPVGVDLIPSGPYNEEYCYAHFGEILVQLQYDQNHLTSKMLLEKVDATYNPITPYRLFYSWNKSTLETKTNIALEVFNMGTKEVYLLNKIIYPHQSEFFNSAEVNFGDLTLFLQANNSYNSILNRFEKFKYKFKLHNIKILNNLYGNNTFTTISNFNICEMNVPINLNQNSNSPAVYFLENRYNNIGISGNIYGQPTCSSYPTLSPTQVYKNIIINSTLVYENTGTIFLESNWRTSKIIADCSLLSTSVPYKKV